MGVALVGIAAVATLGIAELARDVIDAGRARTAADAAALAAVTGGGDAAGRLASAHGATLVAVAVSGADVVVTVRVGDAEASARATGGLPSG